MNGVDAAYLEVILLFFLLAMFFCVLLGGIVENRYEIGYFIERRIKDFKNITGILDKEITDEFNKECLRKK